jgi:DNA-binding transcriptional regulator LsrR (DeoR family)
MRKVAALTIVLAALVFAASAAAKLTAAEEQWAKPMISVWNQQNLALHVVLQAAAQKDALVAGTTNNQRLRTILNTFVVCGPLIRKAGSPPSGRLSDFASSLSTACTHDSAGANDFAKAVGAVGKNKAKQAESLLKQGVAQFKLGSAALGKAYTSLKTIGGANIFKA